MSMMLQLMLLYSCSVDNGLSASHILPSCDVGSGMVDYTHCVLEGGGKKLINMWVHGFGKPFYIKHHMQKGNSRLLGMKSPDAITRMPRGFDQASQWKAF